MARTHTHTLLAYVWQATADTQGLCGIVTSFGAGGAQLFASFIFDLGRLHLEVLRNSSRTAFNCTLKMS